MSLVSYAVLETKINLHVGSRKDCSTDKSVKKYLKFFSITIIVIEVRALIDINKNALYFENESTSAKFCLRR